MIALLIAGIALADSKADIQFGAPMARTAPYRFETLDPLSWPVTMSYTRPPVELEGRVHVGFSRVGLGHARLGLGVRSWSADIVQDPVGFAPRELLVDLSVGLFRYLHAYDYWDQEIEPGGRAFVTLDLGPSIGIGWMRSWGTAVARGLPLSTGVGLDIGRGRVVWRSHLRLWGTMAGGGRDATWRTPTGDFTWSWTSWSAGVSAMTGIAFR